MRSQITNKIPKNNTNRPLRNTYEGTSKLRFELNIKNNLFS